MLSKEFMVNEIKKHADKYGQPYTRCRVPGGTALLESAPERNIYGMYVAVCLTGRKSKSKEKQLEFNF